MLRNSIYFSLMLGLSLAAFGCSGSDDETKETPAPDPSEEPYAGAQPPADPEASGGDADEDTVLAIKKLFLGDADRNDNPSNDAWKEFGYNLDGFKSTNNSKNLCKPRAKGGAAKLVHADGAEGIDNAFGKSIIPIIGSFVQGGVSKTVNEQLDAGKFTIMVKLDKLGTGTDYSGIAASLFGGGNLDADPKWDGTDEWPVLYELLENGDKEKPLVKFANSYVANRTWVGQSNSLKLSLDVQGYALTLSINHAILSMDLNADNTAATKGVIAGILKTDELVTTIKSVAGKFSASLCEGNTLDGVLEQLAGASDILSDATQDPNKECDAISIGLGFDAGKVLLGDVTEKSEGGGEDACGGE